jgi:hypothetical protein
VTQFGKNQSTMPMYRTPATPNPVPGPSTTIRQAFGLASSLSIVDNFAIGFMHSALP